MKITGKMLSVPPYISTSWRNISALQASEGALLITLKNGSTITVPNLDSSSIDQIFSAHETFVEKSELPPPRTPQIGDVDSLFPTPVGGDLLSFGGMIQHNPSLSTSPDLPQEAVDKIREMKGHLDADLQHIELPAAQPHCNCPYCQVARILHERVDEEEEEVSDDDLTFRESEWDVTQEGDKLFVVTHAVNRTEEYRVFIGTPVGCTCGKNGCDHIKAVLNS